MRSVSCAVLMLSALMVAASIDGIPDPPAVTPHALNVKAPCLREFVGGRGEERLTCDSVRILAHVPIHRVSLADALKPMRPSDWITSAGYAADSSPPVL